jgi:hypothetical protein
MVEELFLVVCVTSEGEVSTYSGELLGRVEMLLGIFLDPICYRPPHTGGI